MSEDRKSHLRRILEEYWREGTLLTPLPAVALEALHMGPAADWYIRAYAALVHFEEKAEKLAQIVLHGATDEEKAEKRLTAITAREVYINEHFLAILEKLRADDSSILKDGFQIAGLAINYGIMHQVYRCNPRIEAMANVYHDPQMQEMIETILAPQHADNVVNVPAHLITKAVG